MSVNTNFMCCLKALQARGLNTLYDLPGENEALHLVQLNLTAAPEVSPDWLKSTSTLIGRETST